MPGTRSLIVVETDHNEYNEAEKAALNSSSGAMAVDNAVNGGDDAEEATIFPLRGPIPPADGKWASCIRVIEPASGETLELLELSGNEAAFSVSTCRFSIREEETFVIVGTAQDLVLHPRRAKQCYIHVYRLIENRLQLLHKTEVEDVPLAIIEFQGKLLVGVGKTLRLYELVKKKLLRKCENKLFPSSIVKITALGDRIYVGDMTESVHFAKYKRLENSLVIFADDTFPR
jgi:splicing factor 3B subunit 3